MGEVSRGQRRGAMNVDDLRRVLERYHELLEEHRAEIDGLNVYPVPDGDTGTNMALTVRAVVDELQASEDLPSFSRAVSRGALAGARGNSGVILAQILSAMTARLEESGSLEGRSVAAAFDAARAAAYASVENPVEGTMLSVVDSAARRARSGGPELLDVLCSALEGAHEAVAQGPNLLPALRNFGGVDAGGRGLALFFNAFVQSLGEDAPVPPVEVRRFIARDRQAEGSGLFEVMLLLETEEPRAEALKAEWRRLGDSLIVMGGDGSWRCHIHTRRTEAALAAARSAGKVLEAEVAPLPATTEDGPIVLALCPTPEMAVLFDRAGAVPVAEAGAGGEELRGDRFLLPNAIEPSPAWTAAPGTRVIAEASDPIKGLAAALAAAGPGPVQEGAMRAAAAACRTTSVWREQEGAFYGPPGGAHREASNTEMAAAKAARAIAGEATEVITLLYRSGKAQEAHRVKEALTRDMPGVAVEVHGAGDVAWEYLIGAE